MKRLLLLAFAALLAGCDEQDKIDIQTGEAMGTTYRIKTVGKSEASMPAIREMLAGLDRDLSTWNTQSWVGRFNEAPAGTEMEMPDSVVELLELSEHFHQDSGGCFDPTIGALIRLWGFGAWKREWKGEPDDGKIQVAMQACGFQNLRVDGSRITKLHGGLMFDFSAIAKGYAVDHMGSILRKEGINDFIIEFGGDILASGNAPGKSGWTVGGSSLESPMTLLNQAIATSGSDFNYRGKLSHILDPRDGRPVPPGAAVFATAGTCAEADALATARFVEDSEEPERRVAQ